VRGQIANQLTFTRSQIDRDLRFDSAEKPSVHPSRASARTKQRLKSLENFPFMLSLVEAFIGFFSGIRFEICHARSARDSPYVAAPISPMRESARRTAPTTIAAKRISITPSAETWETQPLPQNCQTTVDITTL